MNVTTKTGTDQSKASSANVQPGVRPVHMTLFPTLDSLESCIDLGISQLPIQTPNELVCLLMTYHNSLLKRIEEAEKA